MTLDRTAPADRAPHPPPVAGPAADAGPPRSEPPDVAGADEPSSPDLRYVAVGALVAASGRLRGVARTAAGVTRTAGGQLAGAAFPLVPGPVRRTVASLGRRLDEQGRSATTAGSAELARLVRRVSDAIGRDPNALRLVEHIVEEIQWRVVDTVLPVVLDRLAAEPDQVRAIVQGQSRGMVDELTTTVRSRAVTGDEAVDRLVARLLRRRGAGRPAAEPEGTPPLPAEAPPPDTPPAGA